MHGLWWWRARHPEWRPGARPQSSADWPPDVGCTLYEISGAAVFIDPLVPADAPGAFWRWADERCHGREVSALTTIGFHRRSRDEIVERYGAGTSRARRNLPAGVQSMALRGAGETIFWLTEPRTLVVGDRIIGDDNGSLRLCPESWLRYLRPPLGLEALRGLLLPLLELPVERVLVSHGEPVLADGHGALRQALG